jgi:hypothetical protein
MNKPDRIDNKIIEDPYYANTLTLRLSSGNMMKLARGSASHFSHLELLGCDETDPA